MTVKQEGCEDSRPSCFLFPFPRSNRKCCQCQYPIPKHTDLTGPDGPRIVCRISGEPRHNEPRRCQTHGEGRHEPRLLDVRGWRPGLAFKHCVQHGVRGAGKESAPKRDRVCARQRSRLRQTKVATAPDKGRDCARQRPSLPERIELLGGRSEKGSRGMQKRAGGVASGAFFAYSIIPA